MAEDDQEALINKNENKGELNNKRKQKIINDERYCCCCSDTVCIGFAWGIFVIALIIFILAICFKFQKD